MLIFTRYASFMCGTRALLTRNKTVFLHYLGDHGGDSVEELSAALYIYSKKNKFQGLSSETVTVNQVSLLDSLFEDIFNMSELFFFLL